MFTALLPYIEGGQYDVTPWLTVPLFISPNDPSRHVYIGEQTKDSSYAANAQVFGGRPTVDATFRDDTSQTILFSEHYLRCGLEAADRRPQAIPCKFVYAEHDYDKTLRRATFADGGVVFGGKNPGDVHPVTTGSVTRSSRPGATFQVAPDRHACDPALPQAASPAGLLTAIADGSVRTVRPGVSEQVFWGAVTPAGGEVLADW